MSNHLLQPVMVDVVKVTADVRFEHVPNLPRDDDLPQCPQGLVRIAPRPKSIRAFEKVRLEYRFQNPRHRSLQQTVLDSRNSERPSPLLPGPFGISTRRTGGASISPLFQSPA